MDYLWNGADLMGVAQQILAAGGGSYDPAAEALFARMSSQPDSVRKKLISDTIVALKTAGVWSKLDCLWLMAAHDSQAAALNWVGSSFDLTPTNSPTFTTDRGFTSASTGSRYLDTGFAWGTAGGLASQNSYHIGVWPLTSSSGPAHYDMGDQSSGFSVLATRSTSNAVFANVATGSGYYSDTPAVTDGAYHLIGTRSSSSTMEAYKNGTSLGSASSTSSASANTQALWIGRTVNGYVNKQFFAAHIGAGLSSGEAASLYSALNTYKTAVGA